MNIISLVKHLNPHMIKTYTFIVFKSIGKSLAQGKTLVPFASELFLNYCFQ